VKIFRRRRRRRGRCQFSNWSFSEAVPNGTSRLITAIAAIRTNMVFAFQNPNPQEVVRGVAVTMSQRRFSNSFSLA
jgi:hypothetical protein